ncbi:MAG: aminopeptidase P family protein [Desulfobacterales bacterium]|nr:aminopeptidase P family protein [Desulfobacterales bacterium]
MDTKEKLIALRQKMEDRGIAAVIIPSGDPHQSEYTAAHWQARHWLTGFTGSAGTAVVTKEHAIVWTDFRYWIQARAQMDEFELFRQGDDGVPDYDAWLVKHLDAGERIALDGCLVSAARTKKLRAKFEDHDIKLDTTLDLISALWTDRGPMPATPAFVLEDSYAGRSRTEKLDDIRKKMGDHGADVHLITALDDIAWTFNLRGADVHTNPVNLAFALITPGQARLFINPGKVDQATRKILEQDKIILEPYEAVDRCLAGLDKGARILIDPEAVSDRLFRAVNPDVKIIKKTNPATELKCLKNRVEINHMRDTAVKDGRAVVNFLHWLETSGEPVTEISAAEKILGFRREQEDFINASFDSIMAFGEHSAMCHYSATKETDVTLTPDAMFLNDSGGNYLTGTTDITRTLHLGTPSDREIRDYTLVLKGHIAVATSRFPAGTRGYQIDTLARQYLWQQGMDFGHGTGHGVGFFLCVHEGPARISPHPVDEALKPGMLLTNEPGLYREGHYGIRLENMILVTEDEETEFGRFLGFENLTLCHFERELLDRAALTEPEIRWIDDYHKGVCEKLAPGLSPEVQTWLEEKTKPL